MKQTKTLVYFNEEKIEVTYKRMNSIRLKFNQKSGDFKVSAPHFLSENEVRTFLESKKDWIFKHRLKFENRPKPILLTYKTGEKHWFLGQEYVLEIREVLKGSGCSILQQSILVLQIPKGSTAEERADVLNAFYRQSLKHMLPTLISKWEDIIGVKSSGFLVRKMKTRWGTCNIRSKRITINLELIKHPQINIEHVIVHELTHLLERGHTKRFYNFLDQFQPGWQVIDADIKKRGLMC